MVYYCVKETIDRNGQLLGGRSIAIATGNNHHGQSYQHAILHASEGGNEKGSALSDMIQYFLSVTQPVFRILRRFRDVQGVFSMKSYTRQKWNTM